jgi:hypothetical protein
MTLAEHPDYAPFFKMKKMRVPPPAIKQKMEAAGLDSSLIDMDGDSPAPGAPVAAAAGGGGGMTLAEHPDYAPFFKMKKMRVPPPAIKQKMVAAGLDPSMIDKDGSSPAPGGAPPAKARPAGNADLMAALRGNAKNKLKKSSAGRGQGTHLLSPSLSVLCSFLVLCSFISPYVDECVDEEFEECVEECAA